MKESLSVVICIFVKDNRCEGPEKKPYFYPKHIAMSAVNVFTSTVGEHEYDRESLKINKER